MNIKEAYAAQEFCISVRIKPSSMDDWADPNREYKITSIHRFYDSKITKKVKYSAELSNSGRAVYVLPLEDIEVIEPLQKFVAEKVALMEKKSLKQNLKILLEKYPTKRELNAYIGSIVDEIKKGKRETKIFKKPTLEEIKAYCDEKGYTFDVEEFYNHYEANGWKVGKVPMKSWQAALVNWNKRQNDFAPKSKDKNYNIDSTYDINEIQNKALFNENYDI